MDIIPGSIQGSNFCQYVGSLTIPPCNEGMLWTVFTETQKVSKRQVCVTLRKRHIYVTCFFFVNNIIFCFLVRNFWNFLEAFCLARKTMRFVWKPQNLPFFLVQTLGIKCYLLQLAYFRSIMATEHSATHQVPMATNHRPVQPLNERTVFCRSMPDSFQSTSGQRNQTKELGLGQKMKARKRRLVQKAIKLWFWLEKVVMVLAVLLWMHND